MRIDKYYYYFSDLFMIVISKISEVWSGHQGYVFYGAAAFDGRICDIFNRRDILHVKHNIT